MSVIMDVSTHVRPTINDHHFSAGIRQRSCNYRSGKARADNKIVDFQCTTPADFQTESARDRISLDVNRHLSLTPS